MHVEQQPLQRQQGTMTATHVIQHVDLPRQTEAYNTLEEHHNTQQHTGIHKPLATTDSCTPCNSLIPPTYVGMIGGGAFAKQATSTRVRIRASGVQSQSVPGTILPELTLVNSVASHAVTEVSFTGRSSDSQVTT